MSYGMLINTVTGEDVQEPFLPESRGGGGSISFHENTPTVAGTLYASALRSHSLLRVQLCHVYHQAITALPFEVPSET